jgi:hypothetical protein
MPATSGAHRGHGPLLQHIIWNVILSITINLANELNLETIPRI